MKAIQKVMGIIYAVSGMSLFTVSYASSAANVHETPTIKTIDRWVQEVSNWGRWGDADESGTLNLITPEKRVAAARLVTAGISVSLGHNAMTEKTVDNNSPYEHSMITLNLPGAENSRFDSIKVESHGSAHTHVDALCHQLKAGELYNGYSADVITDSGCAKLGIDNLKNGVFTRGILIDVPRLKGVPWLEPGVAIYPEDLEAWEKQASIRVGAGDVLLVRTGRWARRAAKGPWPMSEGAAGMHPSCAKWLRERDVAAIGGDFANDVIPSGIEGVLFPLHLLAIYAMGMPIFDNLDLEALSAEAAKQKRWEFLFSAAPLRIVGGTASPLNPIATF